MMWGVISEQALHFRSWNDELIVYNNLSGDTHLLGATAAQVLLTLQQTPSDVTKLAESLAPMLQSIMDDEFVFQIDHLLAELDTLALIERT